jgi:hypothetical protein
MPMTKLLSLEEMEERHKGGEDPFALAIEKWIRIRDFLREKSIPSRYREAFHCASTKILFCVDYKGHCLLCPLESICFDDQSLYYQIMRHLQVYGLAGSLLPRTPILEMIDIYIRDLHGCRRDWVRRSN